jgi:hypothetical protein
MGQRLIISESEKKEILRLYEQDEEYLKEKNFLKRYVGKTINLYTDEKQNALWGGPFEITDADYDGFNIDIMVDNTDTISFSCRYNPSIVGYKGWETKFKTTVYNKSLIDNINQQGVAVGIKWCVKPKADFANTSNMNSDNLS